MCIQLNAIVFLGRYTVIYDVCVVYITINPCLIIHLCSL